MRPPARDAAVGAAVLTTLLAVAWAVSQFDRSIEADGVLLDAVVTTAGVPADDTVLPLFDGPCDGSRIEASPAVTDPVFAGARFVLCHHDGGAIGIRENLPTSTAVAGVSLAAGPVLVGGPLGLRQGILLYPDEDGLRWTTSHRRAAELRRSGVYRGLVGKGDTPPRLAFGHAGWGPGQLEAEIAAGAWLVLEPGALAPAPCAGCDAH